MNDDVRYVLEKMDGEFKEVNSKLDKLMSFRERLIGIAMVFGGIGSVIVKAILHTF